MARLQRSTGLTPDRSARPPVIPLAVAALSALCFAVRPAGSQIVGPGYTTPPSIAYGQLYRDVELAAIFPDSKTFPDMIPDAAPATVLTNTAPRKRRRISISPPSSGSISPARRRRVPP